MKKSLVAQWATIAVVVGGGLYLVIPKYEEGPYGKKGTIEFNTPPFTDMRTSMSVGDYRRGIESLPEYGMSGKTERDYAQQAIKNYEYGYTFSFGDQLDRSVWYAIKFGIMSPSLVDPIPRK